jgi:hypothetical protein
LLIETTTGSDASHLITHGHQSDNFNRAGCEWFGESVTRLVSRFFAVPIFGDFMAGLSSEEPDVDEQFTIGRKNILEDIGYFGMYSTLDEPALFDAYEELVGRMDLPWLVVGHSHEPKFIPGVRERDGDCADLSESSPPAWGPQQDLQAGGYLNTGTTGMMKDLVWFATIEEDGGQVITLLNAARLDQFEARVLIRPYRSVAACTPLTGGKREKAQWLEPDAAHQTSIPAI